MHIRRSKTVYLPSTSRRSVHKLPDRLYKRQAKSMDEKPQLEHVHHDSQSEQVTGQDWPEHIEKSLVRKLVDTQIASMMQ